MDAWKATPGNCFQDAYMVLLEGRYLDDDCTVRIAHGYPRLQKDSDGVPAGTRYAHAWIEIDYERPISPAPGVACIDLVTGIPYPRQLFYAAGNIEEEWVRRYNMAEANEAARFTLHYGPWHEGPPGAHEGTGKKTSK
jgi:hypothetical protein